MQYMRHPPCTCTSMWKVQYTRMGEGMWVGRLASTTKKSLTDRWVHGLATTSTGWSRACRKETGDVDTTFISGNAASLPRSCIQFIYFIHSAGLRMERGEGSVLPDQLDAKLGHRYRDLRELVVRVSVVVSWCSLPVHASFMNLRSSWRSYGIIVRWKSCSDRAEGRAGKDSCGGACIGARPASVPCGGFGCGLLSHGRLSAFQ